VPYCLAGAGPAERRFVASSDEDLLVAVVGEVIYRLDADGEIPVTAAVRSAPGAGSS
jgi:protein archease